MPIFLVSFLLFFSSLSFAFPVDQLTDIFLHGGGNVEYQKKVQGAAHQIILSAPKRINNQLHVERDKRVSGELNISLLRLSSATTISEAFNAVENLFEQNGKVEYRCLQRGCGVSSYWANNFFDEKRLSGRDSDQYYIAGSFKYAGAEYWLSVYIVSNALREHLVYINHIKKPLEDMGWSNGYLLPANQELPEEMRSMIVKRLEAQAELDVHVAVYIDGKKINQVSKMKELAEKSFTVLQKKLSKALSVPPAKIHLQIVGGFHTQTPVEELPMWFRLFLYPP
jgi:hypothetical protein